MNVLSKLPEFEEINDIRYNKLRGKNEYTNR